MALSARLEFRQGQQLVMTPQLQQAIRLLQLSNIELNAFVEAELERNPLLERDDEEHNEEFASAATEAAPEGEAAPAEAEAAPEPAPAPSGGGDEAELAKAAKILFGSAKVDGGLEVDAVRKVIKKSKGALAKCYAKALVKDNALEAKVTVEFVVDKKGKTKDAKIKSGGLGDPAIDACLVEVMSGWKFDAPSDGKAKVKYPLTFKPS